MAYGNTESGSGGTSAIKTVLTILIFGLGAVALFLVMTGKLPSPEELGLRPSPASESTEDAGEQEPPAEGLEALSWEDLSRISAEISEAPSREEALKVAANYGICTEDGQLVDDSKTVVLADGNHFTVSVAGILRDEREGGTCGLTFISNDSVALHLMNSNADIHGGWKDSDMRSWLNGDFLKQLPEDLQAALVPVRKLTNNVGPTSSAADVSETVDALWLPSIVEVVGESHWYAEDLGSQYGYWDDVPNAEGRQYAIFSQKGVNPNSQNDVLIHAYRGKNVAWFCRSPYNNAYDFVEGKYFYGVMDSGFPHGFFAPNEELGVVVGFCV